MEWMHFFNLEVYSDLKKVRYLMPQTNKIREITIFDFLIIEGAFKGSETYSFTFRFYI